MYLYPSCPLLTNNINKISPVSTLSWISPDHDILPITAPITPLPDSFIQDYNGNPDQQHHTDITVR